MSPHATAERRRVPPAARLDEIVEAGQRAFATRGYRRTQMADVARALGASPGNLYNYVPGKETLFALALRRATDGPLIGLEPPADEVALADAVQWLERRLGFAQDFPAMEAALRRRRVADPAAEAREVVLELHDVLERLGALVEMVERSAHDVPGLAAVFAGVREDLFGRMARYVTARVRQGHMRPLSDPATTARLIVELVVWTAIRRPHSPDATPVARDAARAALAELATHTLVPDGAGG
jgi:AcrR family transcriptional regulator